MMDQSNVKLLTYPEVAEAFSMTVASARNLARKRRWRKLPSNTGDRKTVRVMVPLDELPVAQPADASPMQHPKSTPDALAILARHIETLQAEVTSLRSVEAQVAGLQAALDASRDDASRLRGERDDYLSRLVASRRWWQFRKAV
jgi:hypothetical protein